MIHITKGDPLIANPGLVVLSSTGHYNDGDSILCASVTTPDEPACWFEAKYVKYGGMVYSISNAEELLAEIVKMDPASLFGKTADMLAQERMLNEIELENTEKDQKDTTTRASKPKAKKVKVRNATPISGATSTTTPDMIVGSGSATSGGVVLDGVTTEGEVSTTPPDIIFDIDPSAGGIGSGALTE